MAAQRTAWTPKRRAAFLEALERTGAVLYACREAGVARSSAYALRQRDEDFALEWHDAEQRVTEKLEREAMRRAVEGVDKAVFYRDQQIATETTYSDTLLIFLLKARDPTKYRENVKVEHSGSISHDLAAMSDEQLRALADGLDAKRTA
jgi:hypothetical protein